MIVLTWRWKVIINYSGFNNVSFWNLFCYKVIGYGVSYLTPTAKVGGEAVRAGLLTRHKIKFDKALSTVVIDKTIELTSSGLFFIIGVPIIILYATIPKNTQWLMITISAIFLVLISYFYYQMISGRDFFGKIFRLLRIQKTKRGKKWEYELRKFEQLIIDFYQGDKKDFYKTMIISAISWLLMFFEFKFSLLMFGENINLMQIFMIITFVGAAYLIPIPMALGSLEASQVSVFKIIRLNQAIGLSLSLLIRVKDMVWALIGLIMLSFYGLRLGETIKNARPLNKELNKLKK